MKKKINTHPHRQTTDRDRPRLRAAQRSPKGSEVQTLGPKEILQVTQLPGFVRQSLDQAGNGDPGVVLA